MSIWIIFLILWVWWFGKRWHQSNEDSTPLRAEFVEIKNDITEDHVLEVQTKFEKRLQDIYLPDAIKGKEIYIYKNLIGVWYGKLTAENRYDDAMVQKFRGDWILYMDALRDKSAYEYLSSESVELEKQDSYKDDSIIAGKKVSTIEEAFATLVGKEATDELARIRVLDDSAFSKQGELIPEGFELSADGKIQPKKKKRIDIFFKWFSRHTKTKETI
jgi:hypothetical protein